MNATSIAAWTRGTSVPLGLVSAATCPDISTPLLVIRTAGPLQYLGAGAIGHEVGGDVVEAGDPAQRHAAHEFALEMIEHGAHPFRSVEGEPPDRGARDEHRAGAERQRLHDVRAAAA